MIKTKMAFLEGWLFFSQPELLENFLNCSDWLDKSRPSKKATFDHINRLYVAKMGRANSLHASA